MIEINESSSTPIYQQIYEKILKLIVLKILPEGDKLPSVRELALILKINPNTIQKAYKALEQNKYIVAEKGKGSFVNKYDFVKTLYEKDVEKHLQENVVALLDIGISSDMLVKSIESMIKEYRNDRD